MQHDPAGLKFGPFWLTPGISRLNACTSFYCSWIFVTLVTFLNFAQPYILREILHVPNDQMGTVTGYLSFLSQDAGSWIQGSCGLRLLRPQGSEDSSRGDGCSAARVPDGTRVWTVCTLG